MPDRRYIRAVIPAGQMRKGHDFAHSKRQMINNYGRPKAVVLSELAELFAEAKNR